MICSFPLLMAFCSLMQTAAASGPTGTSAQKSDVVQSPAPPSAMQAVAPAQQQGNIPPRDPRLPPPPVQETTVPPNVNVPPPPAGNIPIDTLLHPITADEAARIALLLQPNIVIAKAGITVQGGVTRQIKSALFPRVTVLTGYTHLQNLTHPGVGGVAVGEGGTGTGGTGSTGTGSTGTTGTGTTGTGSTGTGTGTGSTSVTTPLGSTSALVQGLVIEATLTQMIYDFNHTLDQVRQSEQLERAASQNLTRVQSDTVQEVKQAFYQLVQNLQLVKVNEQEVGNRQSQLDLARSRYNVGLGVPIDVVNAETAKAEAVINLSQARANAEQARINLAILMGIDPRTPLVPAAATEPPLTTNDVNALTRIALTQRPEVIQARYSLRSAQYGVSAARSTNAPTITGGTSIISGGDEFLPQENNLTIGLSINWTPIDGGLTRGLVQQAHGNVIIAQQQLIVAQQTAKSDVASAYVNLRTAEQQIPAALADVANAENGVSIATGRYSTGIGVFLDIINAQAFLLTARTNLVNTQGAVEQYRVALAHAIGAPVSSIH